MEPGEVTSPYFQDLAWTLWDQHNFIISRKSSIPWIDIHYSITLKQKKNLPKYFTMKLTTKLTTYKSDIVLTVFKKWLSQKADGLKFEHL